MTFRKTTLAVGTVLAVGFGAGSAGQATAGSWCGKTAGYHGLPHGHATAYPSGYRYSAAPGHARMMHPMAGHPAMYWGPVQQKAVKITTSESAGDAPGDIVAVAVGAGSFDTLATALQAAELVETLQGEGPFTVFAPTDEAFAKIPEAQLEALLADKEKLTAVLTYHVVPGKVMAADVVGLESATTVQGETLAIDTADGVKVGDAKVVMTDIEASNGVIHVVDTVLMPE